MRKITTVFLCFNGVGVVVFCLMGKYVNPEWNIVAAGMFMFGFIWLLLAIASSRSKTVR